MDRREMGGEGEEDTRVGPGGVGEEGRGESLVKTGGRGKRVQENYYLMKIAEVRCITVREGGIRKKGRKLNKRSKIMQERVT